jgi:hypothetical protein
MATQKDFLAIGVKLIKPKGLDSEFKFVLPQFIHDNVANLRNGVHIYSSFLSLKEAYPDPRKLQELQRSDIEKNGHIEREKTGATNKRERRPNMRYLSFESDSFESDSSESVPTTVSSRCAVEPCLLGTHSDVVLRKCIVCGKNVHHMCSSEKYREITASDQWCSDQCYQVSTSSTENMVSTFEIEDDAYQHTKTPASTNNKKQEETVSRNQCEEWKIQVPSVLNSQSSGAVSSGISGMLSSEIVSSDHPLLEPVSFVDLLNQNTPGSSIQSVSMYSFSSSESDEDQNEYDDFEMDPLDKDENDSDDGMSGSENEINSIEEPAFYSTKTAHKLFNRITTGCIRLVSK